MVRRILGDDKQPGFWKRLQVNLNINTEAGEVRFQSLVIKANYAGVLNAGGNKVIEMAFL